MEADTSVLSLIAILFPCQNIIKERHNESYPELFPLNEVSKLVPFA